MAIKKIVSSNHKVVSGLALNDSGKLCQFKCVVDTSYSRRVSSEHFFVGESVVLEIVDGPYRPGMSYEEAMGNVKYLYCLGRITGFHDKDFVTDIEVNRGALSLSKLKCRYQAQVTRFEVHKIVSFVGLAGGSSS